jgi:phosphoribosylanthranilate isomerase
VSTLFTIKICGVTRPDDARMIAEAGADAIGLNFYPRSKRYVSPETAKEIAAAAPTSLRKVGVFVNSAILEVLAIADETPLDVIQLHGDEPPTMLAELKNQTVVRAFRVSKERVDEMFVYIDEVKRGGGRLDAVLIDACQPDAYGGTGKRANWHLAREIVRRLDPLPVILAGGLTPDNVAQAVATVRPAGVDVAGGVESAPGVKDSALARRFVDALRV